MKAKESRPSLKSGDILTLPKNRKVKVKICSVMWKGRADYDGGLPGVSVKWIGNKYGTYFYPCKNEDQFFEYETHSFLVMEGSGKIINQFNDGRNAMELKNKKECAGNQEKASRKIPLGMHEIGRAIRKNIPCATTAQSNATLEALGFELLVFPDFGWEDEKRE